MSNHGQRPIFVIGTARSGTTLLRIILSSHPHIYIPPESDFIPRLFLRRPHAVMTREQAARKVRIVLGNRRFLREWRSAPLDPETFVAALPELTPAAFLDSLYSAYAKQYDAVRWGDKSPIYTNYIGLLADLFPKAQFVHLIRDGRDTAVSALAAYRDRFYVDIYYAAKTWRDRVEAARKAGAVLAPDRYTEVRYEELTTSPVSVVESLCTFLGEPFELAMCSPENLGRELLRPHGRHAPAREPIRPNSGGWRTELRPADQRVFASVAARTLNELHYPSTEAGTMPASERLRYTALATKYHALETGRRVLQSLGVFQPH